MLKYNHDQPTWYFQNLSQQLYGPRFGHGLISFFYTKNGQSGDLMAICDNAVQTMPRTRNWKVRGDEKALQKKEQEELYEEKVEWVV